MGNRQTASRAVAATGTALAVLRDNASASGTGDGAARLPNLRFSRLADTLISIGGGRSNVWGGATKRLSAFGRINMRAFRWALGAVTTLIGLVCVVGALRADPISDTLTAQARLKQLGQALAIYLNDNGERLDDPVRLWEGGDVEDPEVFWNPGDSDPAPGSIETSVPNVPNSARISFEFVTGDLGGIGDHPLIWDNTPANNGGGFISYVTVDGAIETDPPNVSPVPTNVAVTQAHLRRLWWALTLYASDNDGMLPNRLSGLYYGCSPLSARNFWNPGDADPMPTVITGDSPNTPYSARVSFDFPIAGLIWDDIPDEAVVLADNSVENNGGFGINVIDRRGFTRFVAAGTFGDATGDGDIDLQDFARLQQCFTGWPDAAILDNTCRILDWDGDDRITAWDDHEHFVQVLTGPQL